MNVNDYGMIDKAVRIQNRNERVHHEGVKLFVKVPDPSKLDGPISRVGFDCDVNSRYQNQTQPTQHRTVLAQPFVGSKDYFELPTLEVEGGDRNVGSGQAQYVGDLFVETDKGTRYPILPLGGGKLYVDQRLADDLSTQFDPGPVTWAPGQLDVGSVPKTADFEWPSAERYLNPDGER